MQNIKNFLAYLKPCIKCLTFILPDLLISDSMYLYFHSTGACLLMNTINLSQDCLKTVGIVIIRRAAFPSVFGSLVCKMVKFCPAHTLVADLQQLYVQVTGPEYAARAIVYLHQPYLQPVFHQNHLQKITYRITPIYTYIHTYCIELCTVNYN